MDGRENPTNSGTPETSTRGGIFSSPDLTVNTENVPTLGGERENPTKVSEGNAERIAAAFSGTDATRQKAATAAAMENQPLVTPIPSTATGDIQLSGEKKKRSKLPFIIALVAVVAVAVGVGVAIIPGLINNSKINEAKSSFNAFANFLLYGTESDAKIEGNYMYGDQYYLADKTAEQASEHLHAAEAKYQKFLRLYEDNLKGLTSERTNEIIDNYAAQLDLFSYLQQYPNFSAEMIISLYIARPELVASVINEYYAQFATSAFAKTKEYAENYAQKTGNLLTALEIYNNNGCVDSENRGVATECRLNTEDPQLAQANELYEAFANFFRQQNSAYNDLTIKVFQNVWYITEGLDEIK